MNNEKREEINSVKMNTIVSENPKYKIKSTLTLVILILVAVGLIFFAGTIMPEFFVFIMFLLILSLPIIILLRKKIYNIVPNIIKESLVEIDQSDSEKKKNESFKISTFYKQVIRLIFVFLLFLGSLHYLKKFNKEMAEKKSILKFLGSFICLLIGGVTILDMDEEGS